MNLTIWARDQVAWDEIVDCLTRRQVVLGGAVTGVLSIGRWGALSAAAPTEPSGTRVVDTDDGPVDVPVDPQRVVAIDLWSVWTLLDLGVVPVGIPEGITEQSSPPDVVDAVAGVASIGVGPTVNTEAVAALQPDLIVDQFYPESSRAMTEIAPVAFMDWRDGELTWRQQLVRVADAVNRSERLGDDEARYEARIADIADTFREQIAATRWATASGGADGQWVFGSPLVSVYSDLGLQLVESIGPTYAYRSLEQLDLLSDADVITYPQLFDGTTPGPTADLHRIDVWKRLPAVTEGRVYGVRYHGVSTYRWALAALDEIVTILESF